MKPLIQLPRRLSRAKTVGICSPSGAFSDTDFKNSLFESGVKRIKSLGFEVRESLHCRSSWFHMSSSAKDRAADLHSLVDDPFVDIVLPSIGGHVAAQMLPYLDFDALAASGCAICGFSDNSIIPLILSSLTGAVSLHSLCDVTFGFGRFAEGGYDVTETGWLNVVRNGLFDLAGTRAWRSIQPGNAEGIMLGGNLRALLTLAGTRWWPDWNGKILFWEAGDPLHAIQQDLTQLANCGVFEKIQGMVIGRTSKLNENFYRLDQIAPLEIFLLDILNLRGRFPILADADIGHDVENVTIPLGMPARLTLSDESIEWSVVQ